MRAALRGAAFALAVAGLPLAAAGAQWVQAPGNPQAPAAPPGQPGPPQPLQLQPAAPAPPAMAPQAPAGTASATEDIRDIRPPRPLPSAWPWIALALAVVAVVMAGWLLWRRFRARPAAALSPEALALARLEGALRWMAPEHAREFCYEVSEAVRGYIEQRFGILAPRRTTEEFLRDVVASSDAQLTDHRDTLSEFMEHCDMAKYAGWRFTVREMEAMHASARAFVTVTARADERASAAPREPQPPAGVPAGAAA